MRDPAGSRMSIMAKPLPLSATAMRLPAQATARALPGVSTCARILGFMRLKMLNKATPLSESATAAMSLLAHTSIAVPGVSAEPMMPVMAGSPSRGFVPWSTSTPSGIPSPSESGLLGLVP